MVSSRLLSVIKKYPIAYYPMAKVYSLLGSSIGMRVRERWWANRHIAEGYWANRNHPSKQFLVDRIATYAPIDSILEVGCNSGTNLYQLAKRFPEAQITGIDINKGAIMYGNIQFKREGLSNVKLLIGRADKLGGFQDGSFDIVFTNAVLTHIGDNKIKQVISEMFRVSKRILILMEPHSFGLSEKELLDLGIFTYHGGQWIRDYETLLKQFVPETQIEVTKIPEGIWDSKPWKELGAIIEVTK